MNSRAWEERDLSSTRARLDALIGDRRRTIVVLVFCSIVSGIAEAAILVLLAEIVTTTVKGGGSNNQLLGAVHVNGSMSTLLAIAGGLAIFRVVIQIPMAILPSRIASSVQARLRVEVFRAFTLASWEVKSSEREGHLQEQMTSQVLQATGGALQATSLVISAVSFLVLMTFAVVLNITAALLILVAAVVLFGLLRPLNTLGARKAAELSETQMGYAASINEASRLAEETEVFGVSDRQQERVHGFIRKAEQLFFRVQVIARLAPSLYQSAIYLILIAGLAGVYANGATHFASLGAVILLIVRAGTYGQAVQGSYQGLRQSLPFIEGLQTVQRRYASSHRPDGDMSLPSVQTIAFESLSFAYKKDRPVLKDITFEVSDGESIGVVGPSGAGKSTLVQILLQLRDPDSGHYLVNGFDASEYRAEDWSRCVAYVPQQPRLLHASVTDNIRYFRDLDHDAVERAARLARIHDDITGWREGYDTLVGPRADAVSGGQQQRICLARALAARPQVLVLDEPTSALDPHSENLIQESLTGLRHELTLFIIAHRMSTLDICDRVMVIQDGHLAAFDTTDSLRVNNPYYRLASTLAAGGALP
jgi:ATP-binding cassette subfamily B protein